MISLPSASFAAWSAASFPRILTWLGTHVRQISMLTVLNSLVISLTRFGLVEEDLFSRATTELRESLYITTLRSPDRAGHDFCSSSHSRLSLIATSSDVNTVKLSDILYLKQTFNSGITKADVTRPSVLFEPSV